MNELNQKNSPQKTKNSTNLFFSGVIVLTVSNILIKAIGLLFKIPLNHIVGDTGMGYFNAAYTIYTWFYMISTAGLPIAVSIMISDSRAKGNFKQVKRIFNVTLLLFVIIGLVGMSAMIFGSKWFAAAMKADPTYLCIIAIAPTLFFICISSAIRGFFQGYQQMIPTAISQVIEAVCKLAIGILMAVWSINKGYEIHVVAAFTITGLTIGAALGMLFLTVAKLMFRESKYNAEYMYLSTGTETVSATSDILKRLVITAVPITISASVMSLTNLIDVMIVQRRLQDIGLTQIEAVTKFGNYTTLCVPMFNLPPVLIYPISYSIIPLITASVASGNKERSRVIMESSMRIAAIIAIPSALGLSALSKPILNLFYTAKSVEMAAPLLSMLAPSVFFVCMLSITNALLQACGHERKPIISMLIGAGVKLVSSYILIGIPSIGIYGTPIGTFLCYLTVTVINLYFVAKYIRIMPTVKSTFVKPFIASVIGVGASVGAYYLLSMIKSESRIFTLAAILVAFIIYAVLIFVMKAVSKDDILLIPKGQKIYGILHKLRLV